LRQVQPNRQRGAGGRGGEHVVPAPAARHEHAAAGGGRLAGGQEVQQQRGALSGVEALPRLQAVGPDLQ
jgi:hypothetical protein